MHVARDKVRQGRRRALVRDMGEVYAGFKLEHFHRQVRSTSDRDRGIGELARLRPGERHQFRYVFGRYAGVDDQVLRRSYSQCDGRQVLDRVKGHLVEQRDVDGQRTVVADQKRVPVRRRLGHVVCADIAAGAALVLDNDRLAQRLLQLGSDQARQHIVGATHNRNDDTDRFGGRPFRHLSAC